MNPFIKHLSQLFNKSIRLLAGDDYRNKSYLVALSGGCDSMALAQLAIMNGMKITIAHCNYMLRGDESIGDENMVFNYFESHKIPVRIKHFETKAIAKNEKQSIQLVARKLRYDWFDELAKEHQIDFIITGHHFDDKIETFIINLGRGSGLKGLKGIPVSNGKIIRPLLNMGKDDLQSFCKILHIPYRVDSSNMDSKYKRNFVRNEVLPLLGSHFPGFRENVGVTMKIIDEYYQYVQKKVSEQLVSLVDPNEYGCKLNLHKLEDMALMPFIVRVFLEERSFSMSDIDDMIHALTIKKSGIKLIGRDGSFAISDREKIVFINRSLPDTHVEMHIREGLTELWFGSVSIKSAEKDTPSLGINQFLIFSSSTNQKIIIRNKHDGDRIKSLGMRGSTQKLQDVFTNAKLDYLEKLIQPIFIMNDEIIWVPGIKRSEMNPRIDGEISYIIEIKKLR